MLIPSPSLSKHISLPSVSAVTLLTPVLAGRFYRFLSQFTEDTTLCTTFVFCQRINKWK